MTRPDQPLPNGATVENFQIEKVVGRGGFGVTYLATEFARSEDSARGSEFQRQVAIKEYFPNGLAVRTEDMRVVPAHGEGETTAYFNGLKGFIREANTIAQLDHHNVVRIHSAFESNGTAYFVMPFLQGATLKARIWKEGQLSQRQIENLILPVMEGLEEAHAMGIIHRDFKPDNIVINESNQRPVLIDFGAARAEAADDAKQYTRMSEFVAYTPGYAPFEQYSRATSGNRHEVQVDVYAVCATLYACITGKAPPEASIRTQEKMSRREDPMTPATKVETPSGPYDPHLLAAIDWGLQLIAEDRPASIAILRDAMLGRISVPNAAYSGDDAGTRLIDEQEQAARMAAARESHSEVEGAASAETDLPPSKPPEETHLHAMPRIGNSEPEPEYVPTPAPNQIPSAAPQVQAESASNDSGGGFFLPFIIILALASVAALIIWPEMQTMASQYADAAITTLQALFE